MARIQSPRQVDPAEVVQNLVGELVSALRGEEHADEPVVFEVGVGDSGYFQVVIVWERWSELSADVRNRIVTAAYREFDNDQPGEANLANITMILPVTADQAVEMNILPYSVQCNIHKTQPLFGEILPLLYREGAIHTRAGVELRLPTLDMARQARDRLKDATTDFPSEVIWQIGEQAGRIDDY